MAWKDVGELAGSVPFVDVTFEASMFASSLKVRKPVAGLGSMNLVVQFNDPNVEAVMEAVKPRVWSHDEDADIPVGQLQCECVAKPSGDLKFHVFIMRR